MRRLKLSIVLALGTLSCSLHADPLSIPMSREGSGTSWLPDETPMRMVHSSIGDWNLMLHGNLTVQYIDEGSRRGDDQFGSINWFMAMAEHDLGPGKLTLRGMFSLERWTVGKCGFPDLMQTGEACDGVKLHDQQHPHDLFMEVAASYEQALSDSLGFKLYGGPAGEPALGPTAFPHRTSAFPGPLAPISHHWLDSTHISFGVLTAGIFGRKWNLEASAFNGREPDDNRTDFDLDALDSYAGRLTLAPTQEWSLQVSGGFLKDAEKGEGHGPGIDVKRYTTSAIYHHRTEAGSFWANTLAYGLNMEEDEKSSALLLESSLALAGGHTFYGRAEGVEKTSHDLDLAANVEEHDNFWVTKLSMGYLREFAAVGGLTPGLGASVDLSFYPKTIDVIYGNKTPVGYVLFANLRPAEM